MKTFRRYILATMVAAAMATLAASVLELLAFVFALGMAFLVALIHVLFLGLPIALVLQALDSARWWALMLVGFFVGTVPLALLSWLTNFPAEFEVEMEPQWVPLLGVYGALGGLAFWLVIRKTPKADTQLSNKAGEQQESPSLIRKLKTLLGI